jgi:hypothetical protein
LGTVRRLQGQTLYCHHVIAPVLNTKRGQALQKKKRLHLPADITIQHIGNLINYLRFVKLDFEFCALPFFHLIRIQNLWHNTFIFMKGKMPGRAFNFHTGSQSKNRLKTNSLLADKTMGKPFGVKLGGNTSSCNSNNILNVKTLLVIAQFNTIIMNNKSKTGICIIKLGIIGILN